MRKTRKRRLKLLFTLSLRRPPNPYEVRKLKKLHLESRRTDLGRKPEKAA